MPDLMTCAVNIMKMAENNIIVFLVNEILKAVCLPLAINIPGRFKDLIYQLGILSANQADRRDLTYIFL